MQNEIPHAVKSGIITIFGIDLKCHILSDGQRIVEKESMDAFTDHVASSGGAIEVEGDALKEVEKLTAFMQKGELPCAAINVEN